MISFTRCKICHRLFNIKGKKWYFDVTLDEYIRHMATHGADDSLINYETIRIQNKVKVL